MYYNDTFSFYGKNYFHILIFIANMAFFGSGPDRGQCSVEHRGEIPYVLISICMSIHLYIPPPGWLRLSEGWLRPPLGWTGRQDGWTEFPPYVLQDIVPCWVHCPVYI